MSVKLNNRQKIKAHIRHKISGTAEKPRLTVFRSNSQIYAQVVDDLAGKTIVAASSNEIKDKMSKKEQANKVGETLAKLAIEKGISQVVFDRNGYLYHGRVKEVAEGARKGGLKL